MIFSVPSTELVSGGSDNQVIHWEIENNQVGRHLYSYKKWLLYLLLFSVFSLISTVFFLYEVDSFLQSVIQIPYLLTSETLYPSL